MIRRGSRGRAGITLTEILISILIMGVGLVSLATLFPLGLLRLRNAARMSRSALVTESAMGDMAAHNLLDRSSFLGYFAPVPYDAVTSVNYDPWIQDTPLYKQGWINGVYAGLGGTGTSPTIQSTAINGPGLVVAYDPLWRAITRSYADGLTNPLTSTPNPEGRFACGTDGPERLRPDPNNRGFSADASAHGLQRITSFADNTVNNGIRIPNIFVSPDDVVFQSSDFLTDTTANPTGNRSAGSASPVAPDMSSNEVVNDWRYTWMFTGRRSNAGNAMVYTGDIVIFDSRPFAFDTTTGDVAGERVVEAVFGYSRSVITGTAGAVGHGAGADRTVLLRWRATEPEPEVRVGSWIADVTYERNKFESDARSQSADAEFVPVATPPRPLNENEPTALRSREYQRCHWYQVVRKSAPVDGPPFTGDDTPNMRSMTVIVNRPLQAKTLLRATPVAERGHPVHVNAALVSPYVVNVFPKSFNAR